MKKLAIAAALWIGAAGAAFAADVYEKGRYSSDNYQRGLDWSGPYIGAHGGWMSGDWTGEPQYQGVNSGYSSDELEVGADGWFGGAQVGVNRQFGSVIVGVEIDASAGDFGGSETFVTDAKTDFDSSTDDGNYAKQHDLDLLWFGTARVRAGVAIDNFFPYVTGGLAFGQTEGDLSVSYPNSPSLEGKSSNASADEMHLGWTVGVGLEANLGGGWSVKTEYLYIDLGEAEYAFQGDVFNGDAFGTDSFESDLTFNVFKAGLNYRF